MAIANDNGNCGPQDLAEDEQRSRHRVGDVFQINETHGRQGWVGAFLLATEIKTWGVMGFVPNIDTHDKQSSIYIRLKWSEVDYIGHAPLVPAGLVDVG